MLLRYTWLVCCTPNGIPVERRVVLATRCHESGTTTNSEHIAMMIVKLSQVVLPSTLHHKSIHNAGKVIAIRRRFMMRAQLADYLRRPSEHDY